MNQPTPLLIKAAQAALETLLSIKRADTTVKQCIVIGELEAALAEPQPEPVAIPKGWDFNHAQAAHDGLWEVGHLNEDDHFSPVITVDTGNYYQPQHAEPFARAILAWLRAAPQAQQPDMRHPKIQALIGSNARKDIEMGLVEQLLEDPTCELTCMDMEYWNSTHDKLREKLLTQQPQHEPVGEVVIGEEGMTKGWTVIKWRADLPPIAVGTKLYAEPQASLKPLTREQIDVIWSAQGSFTDRESDYRCFARAIEQSHNIGVKP